MKQEDRDLLIRIGERTNNIWRTVEKMERHQSEQNGHILTLYKVTNKNTVWRRVITGIGSLIILTAVGYLTKTGGLW